MSSIHSEENDYNLNMDLHNGCSLLTINLCGATEAEGLVVVVVILKAVLGHS